jgi:hypothetical protein
LGYWGFHFQNFNLIYFCRIKKIEFLFHNLHCLSYFNQLFIWILFEFIQLFICILCEFFLFIHLLLNLIILIIVLLSSLFEISSTSLSFKSFTAELLTFVVDMLPHITCVSTLGFMHLRPSFWLKVLISYFLSRNKIFFYGRFSFMEVLGFELRALQLLGRYCTSWATLSALLCPFSWMFRQDWEVARLWCVF